MKQDGPVPLMAGNAHHEHQPGPIIETVLSPPRPQQPQQLQPLLETPQPAPGGQVAMQRPPPPQYSSASQGAVSQQTTLQPQPLMSQLPMGVQPVQGQVAPSVLGGLPSQVQCTNMYTILSVPTTLSCL